MNRQGIIELERSYWDAMQTGDTEAIARLTPDETLLAGERGAQNFDRDTVLGMFREMPYTLHQYEIRDPQVSMLGRNAAVIAYQVRQDVEREGRREQLDAVETSVWVHKDGAWMCAAHHESMIPARISEESSP